MVRRGVFIFLMLVFYAVCYSASSQTLNARYDQATQTISVFRNDSLLLVQHVEPGIRPYIHPIIAPDGNGILTEFSPPHHKHQTGIYWGLKKLNGRDYFMNWKQDYWRKVSATIKDDHGSSVTWQNVYDLLDETGKTVLTETQNWSMQVAEGKFFVDLQWHGAAKTRVTMEQFYVGGLFVRMPWREGIAGEVTNSEGNKNSDAEGKRARWCNIGLAIDSRKDMAHIAILEHPSNEGFPNAWRVDNELGVGPSRQILGDWSIDKGKVEVIKYRIVVYTGEFSEADIARLWKQYSRD